MGERVVVGMVREEASPVGNQLTKLEVVRVPAEDVRWRVEDARWEGYF
jgi:hypothetical protein